MVGSRGVEILSADAGYGVASFAADVLNRDITPHMPLQAREELEALPTWKRQTYNLQHYRSRCEKVRLARARNRVRLVHRTHGYRVSRKLRIRSEHTFAEAKNQHGLRRARHRGLEKVDRHAALIATVQNLKRLSYTLWRRARGQSADSGYFRALLHGLRTVLAFIAHRRRIFRVNAVHSSIYPSRDIHRIAHCSTGF